MVSDAYMKEDGTPLHGFTFAVWASIVTNAAGGMIVATVMKFAGNILRNFAQACAIIVGGFGSWLLFDFVITARFVGGVALVSPGLLWSGWEQPAKPGPLLRSTFAAPHARAASQHPAIYAPRLSPSDARVHFLTSVWGLSPAPLPAPLDASLFRALCRLALHTPSPTTIHHSQHSIAISRVLRDIDRLHAPVPAPCPCPSPALYQLCLPRTGDRLHIHLRLQG